MAFSWSVWKAAVADTLRGAFPGAGRLLETCEPYPGPWQSLTGSIESVGPQCPAIYVTSLVDKFTYEDDGCGLGQAQARAVVCYVAKLDGERDREDVAEQLGFIRDTLAGQMMPDTLSPITPEGAAFVDARAGYEIHIVTLSFAYPIGSS